MTTPHDDGAAVLARTDTAYQQLVELLESRPIGERRAVARFLELLADCAAEGVLPNADAGQAITIMVSTPMVDRERYIAPARGTEGW